MPTGHVKVFHAQRQFGFLVRAEGGRDLYVNAADVEGGVLNPGDVVEFEVVESDQGDQARDVRVVQPAPPDSPMGRVMTAPPPWDELEERDRQQRQQRRRRR